MANKKIKDLPLLTILDGSEILPTGGKGDYGVNLSTLKEFFQQEVSPIEKNHTTVSIERVITEEEEANADFSLDIPLSEYSTEVTVSITMPNDDTVYDNVLLIPLNVVAEDGEYIFTIKPSEIDHLVFKDGITDFQPEVSNNGEVNLDSTYTLAHIRYFQYGDYKEAVVNYKKSN